MPDHEKAALNRLDAVLAADEFPDDQARGLREKHQRCPECGEDRPQRQFEIDLPLVAQEGKVRLNGKELHVSRVRVTGQVGDHTRVELEFPAGAHITAEAMPYVPAVPPSAEVSEKHQHQRSAEVSEKHQHQRCPECGIMLTANGFHLSSAQMICDPLRVAAVAVVRDKYFLPEAEAVLKQALRDTGGLPNDLE